MTPSAPDIDRIAQRLRLIEQALRELRSLSMEVNADANAVVQAATERFIQVVVDLALDVNAHIVVALGAAAPETARASFFDMARLGVLPEDLAAALAPRAGLRNLLVHHYTEVNFALVAAAVEGVLADFDTYVRAVATFAASWRSD